MVVRKLQMRGVCIYNMTHKDQLGLVKTGYCWLFIILKLELTEDWTAVTVSLG